MTEVEEFETHTCTICTCTIALCTNGEVTMFLFFYQQRDSRWRL